MATQWPEPGRILPAAWPFPEFLELFWQARLSKGDKVSTPSVTIVPVPLPAFTQTIRATPEPILVHVGDDFRIEIRGDFAAPVREKLGRTLKRV